MAEVDLQDAHGRTPRDLAAKAGSLEILRVLCAASAHVVIPAKGSRRACFPRRESAGNKGRASGLESSLISAVDAGQAKAVRRFAGGIDECSGTIFPAGGRSIRVANDIRVH